jgi:two-component system cell cycle sensor histidine kinase/response regulator CckA
MTAAPMRVLLVEDDASYAALISAELQGAAIDLRHVTSLAAAESELVSRKFDAILLDLGLPDSAGVGSVERMQEAAGLVPIVVLTASGDSELSGLTMQRGAQDYLLKSDADAAVLVRSLCHASDRAAFRQSMQDREARFRALVEYSDDAVTLVDEQLNVLYDTRSVVHVCGYTPEERLGQPIVRLLHPDDEPHVRAQFSELLATPDRPFDFRYRFLHRDGTWRWGEAVAVNRLSDHPVQAIVINHRDVTERKSVESALRHSEEQLRQAQKMEAVGRLAGGVAHDFNNVLTAIFGYSDLLLEQFQPDDPRRSDVEEIRRAAERAAALTRQLLAFSRKQIMQPRLLDLNDVINSVQKLLQRLVGDDITLEIRTDPKPLIVRADPGQMEQVLMNLAANARDAMSEGGRLLIATRTEQTIAEHPGRPGLPPGAYAVIEVTDTGTGMAPSVRDHIFEPFYTTKEQGKGTGLGLATVYGIVKQTGGGIYADSEMGQGTTFVVYLPRASSE